MRSFFSGISLSQATELLPKVNVVLELYNRYGSMLAQSDLQQQISSLDEDVGLLLSLIYTKKAISRKEIRSWSKLQEQRSGIIAVSISEGSRLQQKHLDDVEIGSYDKIGLEAIGQGNIYKRTLTQDIDKLLK